MTFIRKLEFYEILPSQFNFQNKMQTIYNKSLVEHGANGKILSYGDSSCALMRLDSDRKYSEGLFYRLKTNDIPIKGSLSRAIFQEIPMASDEGIADMTFFVYIKDLKLLGLLPAKNGVKWGTLTHYIKTLVNEESFELSPLVNKNAQTILNSWRSFTSIQAEINLGNNVRPTSQASQILPLSISLDETKRIGTTKLKIELFNPKKKGGLIAATLRTLGRTIQKLGGVCETEHLKIKGSPSPEIKDSVIDLISQRYQLDIPLGRGGRHLDYEECRSAVREVIENNYNEIRQLVE